MNWPTSQDYNEAVQNAATTLSDPDLKKGEAVCNALGLPIPRSGNFADVYQFRGADGKMWAVKCFTRQVLGLEERYARIDEHLSSVKLPFTVGFQYFHEGIRIRGKWYPILKMEWVEGFTLNEFVRRNADKPLYLHALTQMWGKLASRVRAANFAHADLQHGNVLLVPGTTPSKLGLKLIDYDGMWVPALASRHSGEVGHPNFQHPKRMSDRLYDKEVDRFPHLVIACALRATLVGGKSIWDQFDNGDNLLFREPELRDPASATIFKTLWSLDDPILQTLVGHIALSSQLAPAKTPWLDEILFSEQRIHLSRSEKKQVVKLLGIERTAAPATASPAQIARPVASEFQIYADDEDVKEQARVRKTPPPMRNDWPGRPIAIVGAGLLAIALIVGIFALVQSNKNLPIEHAPSALTADGSGSKNAAAIAEEDSNAGSQTSKSANEPKKEVEPDSREVFKLADPAVGLVAIPGTAEFLYIGPDASTLSWGSSLTGSKSKKIGQHPSRVRTLNCSADGSMALTSTDDGEICFWQLKLPKPDHPFQEVIIAPEPITGFKEKYQFTVYQEGIVIDELATGLQEAMPIGATPCEVSGEFKKSLMEPGNEAKFGPALTDEVAIFQDALSVQVFQGGVMFWSPATQRVFVLAHNRHKLPVKKLGADNGSAKSELEETLWSRASSREPAPLFRVKNGALIRASAIAADNRHAVTMGEDDFLSVWDMKQGKRLRRFKAQTSQAIAFLRDGKRVLVGSDDDSAFGIWNIESEARVRELSGHQGAIRFVCVSTDGKTAYTSGDDAVIRGWNLQTGEQIKELDRNKVVVDAMILRPDDRYVVFADAQGIHAWEPETGKVITLDDNPSRLLSWVNGSSELLCVQSKEGVAGTIRWLPVVLPELRRLSMETDSDRLKEWFTPAKLMPVEEKYYRMLGLSNDGKYCCLLRQKEISIFDIESGNLLKAFSPESWATAFAFGKEKAIYLATREGKVEAWDWGQGEKLFDFKLPEDQTGSFSSITITRDQKRIILCNRSPLLTFLDIGKQEVEKRLSPYPDDACHRAWLYPDDRHLLLEYPGLKQRYAVWDLQKNQMAFLLDEPIGKNIQLAGISPDHKWIVGYQQAEKGLLLFWDAGNGKLQPPILQVNTLLPWVGFSRGGKYFILGDFLGHRSIIRLEDQRTVYSGMISGRTYRAAFSSSANLAVALDLAGKLHAERMRKDDLASENLAPVEARKMETPRTGFLKSSPVLADTPSGACYSSDGKTIFVATQKGILHLLEASTLEEITQYRITPNKLLDLAHAARHNAPNAVPERLYLLDNRRHVYQWDVDKGKLMADFTFEKILPNPNQKRYELGVAPDGSTLIFTAPNGNPPHYWSLKTEKEMLTVPSWLRPPLPFPVKNLRLLEFSRDGKFGAAFAESKLLVWNLAGKNFPLIDTKMTADRLEVISENSLVLVAESGKIEAWNYTTAKHLWAQSAHDDKLITGLAGIPKKAGLVTIGDDQSIRVWDALTGVEIANWKFDQPALSLAISPDGKYALTSHGRTPQLRMWALPTMPVKKP